MSKEIKKSAKNFISGDYQYNALFHGNLIQRQWHKNRLNLLKYLNFFNSNDIVLDLGCGSGNVILEFAPYVKSITGVDNNKECVLFLKKKIKEKNIKNAQVLEEDIMRLKLEKQSFTKIVATEILEHFNEVQLKDILINIRQILIPGGKMIITTPNYQSFWPIIEIIIDKFKLTPKLWGEQHQIKFTRKKLEALINNSCFLIEKIGSLNAFSPFIAPISLKLADKISYFEFKFFPFGNLLYCVAKKN